MSLRDAFLTRGFVRIPQDPAILRWVESVEAAAWATFSDPRHSDWHRHGRTWFAGVNVLENDAEGRVKHGPPLAVQALDLARELYGDLPLDPGQVSIISPGYPRQDTTESDAAHRFRKTRDAAHVDGLLPVGPERRRFLREPHAYILGLPLGDTPRAPLVVWEGSHKVIRRAFARAFTDTDWTEQDITEIYAATRREIFETCPRVELVARKGEATLVHRLTLHGVAPWGEEAEDTAPRGILYFRPHLPGPTRDWLDLP